MDTHEHKQTEDRLDEGLGGMDASPTDDTVEAPVGPPVLAELVGVSKSYDGRPALSDVTLTLERGCVGLLGPNGAGKSTLIRMLMGLMAPTGGTIRVLGEEVRAGEVGIRRRIGYAPEGEARFPGLTGIQATTHAGRLVGMDRASAMQRAHQVLDYVGLGEARYRLVETYSTGMRQKLKLAQALVHDPELLILDEPTEGVDPQAREDILDLISELVRDYGIQLILSTHLLHDVERIATHALILNEGHVVEHGPIEALRTASDRGFQVRLDGPPDALMDRLEKAGVKFEWMPPSLRVQVPDAKTLLAHVEACGAVIRHLSPVELSLNEVFEKAVAKPRPTKASGTTDDAMPPLEAA